MLEAARDLDFNNEFEMNYLLFIIETYLSNSEYIQGIGIEQPGSGVNLAVGVMRVLATGYCKNRQPEPAGKYFIDLGFPKAGALANERGVKTCLEQQKEGEDGNS